MNVSKEFSKYATSYNSYNIIQDKVIKHLLQKLPSNLEKPKHILDLGCGSGSLCKQIDWEYESFRGVDFASGMLALHPRSKSIECIYGDFNDNELFDSLKDKKYDRIFSASALQWALDLDKVFKKIKELNAPLSLAIFTSGTFKTLNKTASLDPLLKSAQEIEKLYKRYFDLDVERVQYKLEFESTREMFQYIKKSGVSGSRKILGYKQTKELIKNYPLTYLEFEVVFLSSK